MKDESEEPQVAVRNLFSKQPNLDLKQKTLLQLQQQMIENQAKAEASKELTMQVEIPVKQRLAQFWSTTIHEVSRQAAHAVDHGNLSDPQHVSEFADGITRHLFETETKHLPSPHYMSR